MADGKKTGTPRTSRRVNEADWLILDRLVAADDIEKIELWRDDTGFHCRAYATDPDGPGRVFTAAGGPTLDSAVLAVDRAYRDRATRTGEANP